MGRKRGNEKMKTKINRRSKNIGFGYTAGVVQGEHGLFVPKPDYQYHTGTVKTILRDLQKDANYQSLQDGTIYTTAWFIKIDGIWYRVKKDQANHPIDILLNMPGEGYVNDSITLELENI